jgi:hypothetical protein
VAKFKSLLNLVTLSSDPISGSAGDVYFNTVSKNLKIHNGLSWVDLTPGSSDPAPFYMHTHTYDGDVHTITIDNKVTFSDDINNNQSVIEQIPAIIGFDGGSPNSIYNDVSYQELTLLDGGEIVN